jgi:hypothetical protein
MYSCDPWPHMYRCGWKLFSFSSSPEPQGLCITVCYQEGFIAILRVLHLAAHHWQAGTYSYVKENMGSHPHGTAWKVGGGRGGRGITDLPFNLGIRFDAH